MRFVSAVVVLLVMLIGGYIFLTEDDGNGGFSGVEVPLNSTEQDSGPSVIRAVHNHVTGKTYVIMQTRWIDDIVSCTEQDADLDVLGTTCSGSDGLYGAGTKTISRPVDDPVDVACAPPPPVDSSSWNIQSTGPDTWSVSNVQGSWGVTSQDRGYLVEANQDC